VTPVDFRLGDFVVRPALDRLVRGGQRIDLEPKTMAVLVALAARPGEVLSSDELIAGVWQGRPMGENPVYKAVAKLRRALDDESHEPRYIETIARKGYRLLAKPQPLAEAHGAVPRAPRWLVGSAALIAAGMLAIGVGYAKFGAERLPAAPPTTSLPTFSLHFPGLESDASEAKEVDAMIRARLAGLPGVSLSERPLDAALASLRLSGSLRAQGGSLAVHLRIDGERGSNLWHENLTVPAAESYRIADQFVAAVQESMRAGRNQVRLDSLSFSALQAYLQIRTELHGRRPGFHGRMRSIAVELLREEPEFASGHAMLAVACLLSAGDDTAHGDTGDLQCARDSLDRAFALDADLAEAHAARGLLALVERAFCVGDCSLGDSYDNAQQRLERAVRLDPALLEARLWLGNTYMERGDLARGAEQRQAALALDPLSPIANLHMNDLLLLRGEGEIVYQRLRRLVRTPVMPYYLYEQLANTCIETHRFAEAAEWARQLAGDRRRTRLAAAVLLARSGALDEARQMEAVAAQDATPYSYVELGYAVRLQQMLGGRESVRRTVDAQLPRLRATPDEGTTMDLRLKIGWAQVLAGQPASARPWLESVYRERTDFVGHILTASDGLEALAWSYGSAGDATRARESAQEALSLLSVMEAVGYDRGVEFAVNRALARKLAGDHAAAIAELERAVTLGWSEPVMVRADPRWSGLDSNPAFQRVLALADQARKPRVATVSAS